MDFIPVIFIPACDAKDTAKFLAFVYAFFTKICFSLACLTGEISKVILLTLLAPLVVAILIKFAIPLIFEVFMENVVETV